MSGFSIFLIGMVVGGVSSLGGAILLLVHIASLPTPEEEDKKNFKSDRISRAKFKDAWKDYEAKRDRVQDLEEASEKKHGKSSFLKRHPQIGEAFKDWMTVKLDANGNKPLNIKDELEAFCRWHGPANLDQGILRPTEPGYLSNWVPSDKEVH